jgi:Recombination endonuclease VII
MPFKDPQKRKEYLNNWQRAMRAALTPEEKKELGRRNSECRKRQYARNPELKERISRRNNLRKYGITLEQYDAMVKAQGTLCKLCRLPLFDEPRKPVIDHCHRTGEVRGVIHNRCNVAIGMLKDDPMLVKRALEYLEAFYVRTDSAIS